VNVSNLAAFHAAAHSTVHRYPGGSQALGPAIGMSPAVLRNRVNPNNADTAISVEAMCAVMDETRDLSMLQALAARFGCVLVEAAAEPHTAPLPLQVMSVTACNGELAHCVATALTDHVISDNEHKQITGIAFRLQSGLSRLVAGVSLHAGRAH
jgi:hypothetical protein